MTECETSLYVLVFLAEIGSHAAVWKDEKEGRRGGFCRVLWPCAAASLYLSWEQRFHCMLEPSGRHVPHFLTRPSVTRL